MPNWINNRLTVKAISNSTTDVINFYNYFEYRSNIDEKKTTDDLLSFQAGKNESNDCPTLKAIDMQKKPEETFRCEIVDEYTLIYRFETSWIPAIFLCINLSKEYPNLEFILHYIDDLDCAYDPEAVPGCAKFINGIADFSAKQRFE